MRVRILSVFLFSIILSLSAQATDTTLLNKRIQKVINLSKELSKLPTLYFKERSDAAIVFATYKDIEPKYFKPLFTSSDFNIRNSISEFHSVAADSGINDFSFRYPDPNRDTITNVNELHGYIANTLIAYVSMYGGEWEVFYFAFEQGTDQLIYLITAGGEHEMYRRKKNFLNQLYTVQKH